MTTPQQLRSVAAFGVSDQVKHAHMREAADELERLHEAIGAGVEEASWMDLNCATCGRDITKAGTPDPIITTELKTGLSAIYCEWICLMNKARGELK